MQSTVLIRRSLTFYWRTNSAVVVGVATAVAVLAGALLVGGSVRASLRDLVLQRIGRTDYAVASPRFFREQLAQDVQADGAFAGAYDAVCPLIVMQGVVSEQSTGRRASGVQLYGVDDRFWRFHRVASVEGPPARDALLSEALAREIGASAGATVLVRIQQPSAVPIESLHGRKEDSGRTLRLTVGSVLEPSSLGEFSLRPQQGDVRAAFVPLRRLQQDLDVEGRVNVLLVSAAQDAPQRTARTLESVVRRQTRLEDLGLKLRILPQQQVVSLEGDAGLIDDAQAEAARRAAEAAGMRVRPILTYLANSLRSGDREVPYSLVTATELPAVAPGLKPGTQGPRTADLGPGTRTSDTELGADLPSIVLNDWAARDLGAKIGAPLTLEYYVWEDPGRLLTRTADFQIAAIVPLGGPAADPDLAPVYPGISDSPNLSDWDPPFPVNLGLVRPIDEDYWRRYRTTPKAFVPLEVGQRLWRSRHGALTSIRIAPPAGSLVAAASDQFADRLRAEIDPTAMGFSVQDVRSDGMLASRGATDFGAYFTYFSLFLVVSALLLAALFFRLGVEQRAREVGLLRALGFSIASVRRLFAGEGLLLALLGSAIGMAGAVGYGYLMIAGLRTWWVDAVGTTALSLHLSSSSLAAGAAGGVIAALGCVWWTLGGLARLSERSLLAGQLAADAAGRAVWPRAVLRWPFSVIGAAAFGVLGSLLLAATLAGWLGRAGAFFGAGTSLLAASLCLLSFRLSRPTGGPLHGHGWWAVSRLGLRNASYRPGRSVLSIAVIASATFILISVDAFRRDGRLVVSDPHSGVGGYPLLVESLLPIARDVNSREGREALNLSSLEGVRFEPFRLLPGEDASCLNLYEPRQPRILGARAEFIAAGRFAFQSSLASTEAERANPWLILERDTSDGAVPVIADANSMTYVLHRQLGEELILTSGGQSVRLRFVAALADSIFQGELLMSETNFRRLFPEQDGYRVLLVETPPELADAVATAIEDRLEDFGADAVRTDERLNEFHRVENTYLSTFQTLGGLGLLLGTVGLATVLLRNVLERRRELALLGAVGYDRAHFFAIVIAENVLLLTWGLLAGAACALIAIAPAVADRGGRLPTSAGGWLLLFAVLVTGLLSSVVATRAAIRTPLLEGLRAE